MVVVIASLAEQRTIDNYLDSVQLSGLLYALASGGATKAGAGGDTVDEAEKLVLDLSSEVGHIVIYRLMELLACSLYYSYLIES